MEEVSKIEVDNAQVPLALAAPGQAAFAAVKQLLVELEPIIGPGGVERVRAKAKSALTAAPLPPDFVAAISRGLD